MKKQKTLLYLASGPVIAEYAQLPYERKIFVDRNRFQASVNGSGLEFIHADALLAIDELKSRNITIHCLVSVNEGLSEGGGDYPVLSDFMMGYLSPILADEFILIYDPRYYWRERINIHIGWGFESTQIHHGQPDFIYPALFANEIREHGQREDPSFGAVIRLKRNRRETSLEMGRNVSFKLVYGSIWDDESHLDMMGINLINDQLIRVSAQRHTSISAFFLQNPKVYDLRNKGMAEIIQYAIENGFKHIGLCPWMDGNYEEVLNHLRSGPLGSIESITFYHLDDGDFAQLYQLTQGI